MPAPDNTKASKAKREVAILFDGSLEGFLCILHAYYYENVSPLIIQTEDNYQPTLDTEEYHILSCSTIATRVQGGIIKKISPQAWHTLSSAYLAAYVEDKYIAMFRYLLLGFRVGAIVDDHLYEDCVLRVHKFARQVGRETHLLTGFCRFEETTNNIYYCPIEPTNYVLPRLAEHFSDRMMNQAWIIHDKKHGKAAVYNGETYVIADVPKDAQVQHTDSEAQIQDLWITFFNSVAIKERVKPKLQRQLLPLYFRKSMTEFQKKPTTRKTLKRKSLISLEQKDLPT
ncbi:MAG: TIGR03915 family putative DNA repair protein [Defluviitaleaceae bacterium]|nr:TIGR03915 family putative DNA repair protein [Defluviitaleaceae bacterium]